MMQIDGPLTVSVTDSADGMGRELHLGFTTQFRALPLGEQAQAMERYVSDLRERVYAADEGSADRRGMALMLQIAEQLLPHIQANEIALSETIVVEIRPELNLGAWLGGVRSGH